MNILGLDVGDKTIGVAKSDPLGYTAQPITTIRYQKSIDAWKEILRYIEEFEITLILVGLPLNMNGTEGPQVEKVRKFIAEGKKLFEKLKLDMGFEFWDERLSTVAAERTLIEANVSRAKRKKVIDKMAAVFILQGYLDSLCKE